MNTERPEVLYHYTTMNALCNMLNGVTDRGDGQTPDYRFRIWVSCADYMNDPLEGVFFRKCLHEAFLRYQSAHDLPDKSGYMPFAFTALNLNRQTFYAFSLSEHADSLPMWVAYGNNGQGVAIGFDTEEFARAAAEYPYCHFLKMAYRTGGELAEMFSDEDMARAYEAIRPREDGGCSVCYADYDFLHDKYSHVKNRYYAAERVPRTERADPPLLRNRVAAEGHPALRHRPVHEPGTFPERARVHAVPQGPGVPQERKEGPPFRGPLRAAIAASESSCANRILRRRPPAESADEKSADRNRVPKSGKSDD